MILVYGYEKLVDILFELAILCTSATLDINAFFASISPL